VIEHLKNVNNTKRQKKKSFSWYLRFFLLLLCMNEAALTMFSHSLKTDMPGTSPQNTPEA